MTARLQRPCRAEHGTNTRYSAGCSCLACCDAHAAYQRARDPKTTKTNVPLAVVQAHIAMLRRKGMSRRAIAEMSGVSYKTLRNIDGEVFAAVTADTAAALLALTGPIESPSTALVSAQGFRRALRGLRVKDGFTVTEIASAMGIARKSLPKRGQSKVQAATYKRLLEAGRTLRANRRAAAR